MMMITMMMMMMMINPTHAAHEPYGPKARMNKNQDT